MTCQIKAQLEPLLRQAVSVPGHAAVLKGMRQELHY